MSETETRAATFFDQAVAHHQAGRLLEAKRLYRQTLTVAPKHADSLHLLGLIARESGETATARDLIGKAIAIDEANATFHNSLGVVLQEMGKLDLAVSSLRRAISLEADYAEAHNNLGNALREQDRLEEAEDAYRRAIALQPQYAKAYNNLGIVLKERGDLETAALSYRRAIEINPNYVEAYNNLGTALTAADRLSEAAGVFGQAIALRPTYAQAHNNLGVVLKEQDKLPEAEASYRKAAILEPKLVDAHVNLGHALFDQGKYDAAAAAAAAARKLDPPAGAIQFPLGDLMLKLGDTKAAEAHLRSYLAFDRSDRMGAKLLLASFGAETLPAQASEAFVRDLYAKRAAFWDRTAAVENPYRGAQLVANTALRLLAGKADADVLDAGCGTGLVGALLRDSVRRIDGVDLSPAMIAAAADKGVYHTLAEGDLCGYMSLHPAAYDAVVSAATLIHFGDLSPVFAAAHTALRPNGVFVFTAFPHDSETQASGFTVAPITGLAYGGCYAHGPNYIQRTAEAAGFTVASLAREIHEHHKGQPVEGLVVSLRRA